MFIHKDVKQGSLINNNNNNYINYQINNYVLNRAIIIVIDAIDCLKSIIVAVLVKIFIHSKLQTKKNLINTIFIFLFYEMTHLQQSSPTQTI